MSFAPDRFLLRGYGRSRIPANSVVYVGGITDSGALPSAPLRSERGPDQRQQIVDPERLLQQHDVEGGERRRKRSLPQAAAGDDRRQDELRRREHPQDLALDARHVDVHDQAAALSGVVAVDETAAPSRSRRPRSRRRAARWRRHPGPPRRRRPERPARRARIWPERQPARFRPGRAMELLSTWGHPSGKKAPFAHSNQSAARAGIRHATYADSTYPALSPAPGVDAGDERHAHELRQAARPHLLHDPGAMDLDRARADPELAGDRLVGAPDQQLLEDLALARGQRRGGGRSRRRRASRRPPAQGFLNRRPPGRRARTASRRSPGRRASSP